MANSSFGLRVRATEIALNGFRIAFGLMFMQHGAQKLFGLFTDTEPMARGSLLWAAGILEFWGGLLVSMGLLTRPVAFVLAGEMLVAYFRQHFPQGWAPIVNSGELAVLYGFAFIYLAANGGGSFSVDGLISKRRNGAGK